MFASKRHLFVSLYKLTRQVGSFVQNCLFARNPQYTKISAAGARLKDLHESIFAEGIIGNKFVSRFKMSLWEKMLLSIKTAHFNFTLIRLNNKSSPQFIRLNGKVSAKQSNCSLHLTLRTLCGSSRDMHQGKPFFQSECNADISSHFSSDHLSKCGDVTEVELIMTS